MTKRIFRAICLVAVAVFLAGAGLIMGLVYDSASDTQLSQLRAETQLAAKGVETLGTEYLTGLQIPDSRVTWIAADGTVLFDDQSDPAAMGSHGDREEILEALQTGTGQSIRYSDTLMERYLYYALRLSDGSVLRLSCRQDSVLTLLVEMVIPMLAVAAVAVVLALLLAGRLSKKIVEPLNRLDLSDPMGQEAYAELKPLLGRIHSQQQRLREQSESLRQAREEFETVTGNMREGLVLLGSDRKVLSSNSAAARHLGTGGSREERVTALLDSAYAGQQAKTTISAGGRDYRVEASPVLSGQTVSGVVLLSVDVTDRERSEEMRREFTANVSHELKTPLHAISGYAELMAGGIARPEDMPVFAANIHTEAKRLMELVEDILRLSQLDEGAEGFAFEETDLYAIAEQTVERLRPVAALSEVSLLLTGRQAVLEGIPQLLGGIVHNLCDNAIKYNRPGGRVEIQVGSDGNGVLLTVVDTGIGIPAEHRERIFERFYRVDKSRSKAVGGTGLGLSIVKHAARIHNARVTLESAEGAGTTVTVRFPRKR